MTWTRTDDTAPHHPKLLRAGAEACWLWQSGLCYSNAHKLDGRLHKELLPVLYPPLARKAAKLARTLCDVRLWHDRGDHYEIHDYAEYQDAAMKENVEARRAYERERKREQRELKSDGSAGGKVYFARVGDRIKIGFSKNPWARLDSLKTGSPTPPELLGYVAGTIETERSLHDRFKHLRENLEWFRSDPELLEYIATVATGSATTVATTKSNYPREGKGRIGPGWGNYPPGSSNLAVEPVPPTGDERMDRINADLGLVRPVKAVR